MPGKTQDARFDGAKRDYLLDEHRSAPWFALPLEWHAAVDRDLVFRRAREGSEGDLGNYVMDLALSSRTRGERTMTAGELPLVMGRW